MTYVYVPPPRGPVSLGRIFALMFLVAAIGGLAYLVRHFVTDHERPHHKQGECLKRTFQRDEFSPVEVEYYVILAVGKTQYKLGYVRQWRGQWIAEKDVMNFDWFDRVRSGKFEVEDCKVLDDIIANQLGG